MVLLPEGLGIRASVSDSAREYDHLLSRHVYTTVNKSLIPQPFLDEILKKDYAGEILSRGGFIGECEIIVFVICECSQ